MQAVSALSFHVRGWNAWAPGLESESAWRHWATGRAETPEASAPPPAPMPMSLRRRISALGQAALRCAWGLPDAGRSRIVSASRHGEFGRTLSILDALAADDTVSPADFTLSVHHALVGLLSIALGNRKGHVAVAAGPDSFGFGLLEAVACLKERPSEPVVFLYYDEPLPRPYDRFDRGAEPPLAMALSLSSSGAGKGLLLETAAPRGAGDAEGSPGLAFLRFLLTDAPEASWQGERQQWQWRRLAEAA
ncbi:3-oxoacyl-ACP synthase [Hypericibacter terrae]|uniref:3-oxoacyl-ACP synthase n=1 Tax=Hypericibacter terrae TaxID=2602015 RepID=A0A5J6MNY4_9PROT|nr:3-oxoacyl-ACP synthase [Hypericibacter terrae]